MQIFQNFFKEFFIYNDIKLLEYMQNNLYLGQDIKKKLLELIIKQIYTDIYQNILDNIQLKKQLLNNLSIFQNVKRNIYQNSLYLIGNPPEQMNLYGEFWDTLLETEIGNNLGAPAETKERFNIKFNIFPNQFGVMSINVNPNLNYYSEYQTILITSILKDGYQMIDWKLDDRIISTNLIFTYTVNKNDVNEDNDIIFNLNLNIPSNQLVPIYDEMFGDDIPIWNFNPTEYPTLRRDEYNPYLSMIINQNIYINKYLTTQLQYTFIMGNNPSFFEGYNKPVENVTWFDSIEYCNRLSLFKGYEPCYELLGYDRNPMYWPIDWKQNINNQWNIICHWESNGYRLLTSLEWQGICYNRGNYGIIYDYMYPGIYQVTSLNNISWFRENSGIDELLWMSWDEYMSHRNLIQQYEVTTKDVGLKDPVNIGVYDLAGNVWQWVWDPYIQGIYQKLEGTFYNYRGVTKDIIDQEGLSYLGRIIRGGSIFDTPKDYVNMSQTHQYGGYINDPFRLNYTSYYSANKIWDIDDDSSKLIGFRICRNEG